MLHSRDVNRVVFWEKYMLIGAKLGGAGSASAPPLFLPRPYIISNISTFFAVKSDRKSF